MEFLVLEVDGARFGVPTSDVREVVRAVSLGAPPKRYPQMAGVMNFRGEVVGVFELACLRGGTHRELAPQDRLIVLQTEDRQFALRVDHAIEIMTWEENDEASRSFAEASPGHALRPIAHPRLGVVYLMDTAAIGDELRGEESGRSTREPEAN